MKAILEIGLVILLVFVACIASHLSHGSVSLEACLAMVNLTVLVKVWGLKP